MLPRLALALVAALVLAGLGVMERNARLVARAQAAVEQAVGPRETARAVSDLRAARRFNPDTTPELELARIVAFAGRPDRAIALVRDVVRREPENAVAWFELYKLARGNDPVAQRQAAARVRRLRGLE